MCQPNLNIANDEVKILEHKNCKKKKKCKKWFRISEKIGRVLWRENKKEGDKPIKTVNHSFPRPKEKIEKQDTRDACYKINCLGFDFVYCGQTGRAIKTRISDPRTIDLNSRFAQHVHQLDHTLEFDNVKVADRTTNYHKRLFLEAWYSLRPSNAVNDHINIPSIYTSLC